MTNGAHRQWKLSDWQAMFEAIYGHRNRPAGENSVWFRVLEEVGEVVRESRYRDADQIRYQLPDIIAWLCAFCSVKELRLSEIAWERYREGCPRCKAKPGCVCPPTKLGRELSPEKTAGGKRRRKPMEREPELFKQEDWTIGEWERFLDLIYGERNDHLEWLDIAGRITEHAGEVAKIIRQRQETDELKKRVADVFAWTVGLWNSVRAQGVATESSVADLLFDKYPNWCPKCRARPCCCPAPVARVFISSVMREDECTQERAAAREVVLEQRLVPVMFEEFKGQFYFDQEAEALRHLADSDALLLILDKTLTPPVYTEFYAAVSKEKQVWAFLRERIEPISLELQEFVKNVARRYRYDRFRDTDDFKYKLAKKIHEARG